MLSFADVLRETSFVVQACLDSTGLFCLGLYSITTMPALVSSILKKDLILIFETGSHVILDDLEVTVELRMTINS